jgi:hypothetical protein
MQTLVEKKKASDANALQIRLNLFDVRQKGDEKCAKK